MKSMEEKIFEELNALPRHGAVLGVVACVASGIGEAEKKTSTSEE